MSLSVNSVSSQTMISADYFFWSLAGVLGGVLAASLIKFPLLVLEALLFSASFLLVLGYADIRGGQPHKRLNNFFWGVVLLGFSVGLTRTNQVAQPIASLDQFVGEHVLIAGRVVREPSPKDDKAKVVMQVFAIGSQKVSLVNVMVTTRLFAPYSVGDTLTLDGSLEKPAENINGFEYAKYLAKDDIFYVMQSPQITLRQTGTNSFSRWTAHLRDLFDSALSRVLPEPEASFARGLLIGRGASFPQDVEDEMRKTSTLHLIAVSGYNITIVALAVMKMLEVLAISRRFSWLVSIFGIFFYTVFVGAPASAVRAAIMAILTVVSRHTGRISYAKNALIFTAALMVLQNPRLLAWDLGFQLSFLATIGIIWVSPRLVELLKISKGSIVGDTLGAQFMVAPWIFYKFGSITLLGIGANFLVMSLVPLMMFWSFAAALGGALSEILGRLIAPVAYILLKYGLGVISLFSRLPLATFSFPLPSFGVVILLYGLIAFLLFKKFFLSFIPVRK